MYGILLTAGTAETQAGAGSLLLMVLWIAIIIGFMYFFMIRPQKKEQKKQQEMISSMEIGDYVLTTSGFYGIVISIQDDDCIVEFGSNKNCRIPMQKAAIADVEKPESVVKAD